MRLTASACIRARSAARGPARSGKRASAFVSVIAIALALSACGQDGGGSSASGGAPPTASPPPTPPPPPSPPPPPAATPSAPFGLQVSQKFALFGWIDRKGSAAPVPITPDLAELSWSATAGTYELSLPEIGPGRLKYSFPGSNYTAFTMINSAGDKLPVAITLNSDFLYDPPLRGAGFGSWTREGMLGEGAATGGRFVFGLPTPAAQIPTSGNAVRYATTFDGAAGAELVFDFASGKLQGKIGLSWVDAWGPYPRSEYELVETSYSRGATEFSARFLVPGAPFPGKLMGRFMAKDGAELAIWYDGPILHPYSGEWTHLSGVLVGELYCSFFVNTPCV